MTVDQDGDGYWTIDNDCNDNNPAINPGATEACNTVDDNCNNQIDEGVLSTFYRDADNDTYGNALQSQQASTVPAGYVGNNTDCNNNSASINPGAIETCNGINDDCDSEIDEEVQTTFYTDSDNDGFGSPTAPSLQLCTQQPGFVPNNTDCNDSSATIHPGATDFCGNGVDEDCNGFDSTCPPPVGSITVTSPNGGETWKLGRKPTVKTIRWTPVSIADDVKIELSRNNGGACETLFASTANDGSQNWTVIGPTTTQAIVHICSVATSSVCDSSNGSSRLSNERERC